MSSDGMDLCSKWNIHLCLEEYVILNHFIIPCHIAARWLKSLTNFSSDVGFDIDKKADNWNSSKILWAFAIRAGRRPWLHVVRSFSLCWSRCCSSMLELSIDCRIFVAQVQISSCSVYSARSSWFEILASGRQIEEFRKWYIWFRWFMH